MLEHIQALRDAHAKALKELNDHIDECYAAHPGEPMSAEENEKEARIQAHLDDLESEIRKLVEREERERSSAEIRDTAEKVFGGRQLEHANRVENTRLAAWLRDPNAGKEYEVSGFHAVMKMREQMRNGLGIPELRNALLTDTGSIGSAVPTDMAVTLYEYLENSIAMFRAPTTKIDTESGNPIEFPKLTAHSIATQVSGQGTVIAGTDPTFNKVSLSAYRYGEIVKVSNTALEDTSFDLGGFVARDIGRALGRVIDTALVTGAGATNPQGLMTAGYGSVITGGSLIPADYDNLIDLVHKVADEYVMNGSAGWLMNRSTAGTLRKLRDGAGGTEGAPLWQSSVTGGIANYREPSFLLDFPVYTDPNVANQGSAAKAIWFGDFASYYLRRVGNPVIERSDERYFDTDEVGFRGKWRVDGDVIDTAAGNTLHQIP